MTCPACGAQNRDGARFCRECATALALACPACGAEHEPGQRFCDHCGTALAGAPAQVAEPVAELRVVSMLFVDLVGSTSLSESRDAEDVRDLLSRYYDTARTIVGRYGGVVEKFIGDAVMAVWGTPVAREDDAERAVRAGLDLVGAVSALGDEVGAPLQARAGVVTGQVASVANPGEGLVVGDRVNTASRVQSIAEPGSVLVDDVTRQASSAAIDYASAGEHSVKGKAQPLRVWRALRVVAGARGAHREEGLQAPFLGRDPELRLVKDVFHATIDRGTARLVAVSGPAGVGKSRLRKEFENYVDGLADDIHWHTGRCLAYGDGVAYWALAQMVRQRLGIPEEAGVQDAERRMLLGLERWITDGSEHAYLAPRLGALLGTADPGLERQELFAGWRLFFERLADHGPVVLAFEDVHWADNGLLDFIEHLLTWSAQRPIFVLALARPELAERRPGWAVGGPGVTPVFLEPLGPRVVAELLDGLVGDLPATARDRIVAQAEGIPMYALETVRALADRGALSAGPDGRLRAIGDLGELEIPSTLSSLLTARLDALPPDERALVKDLAVFGGAFPRAAVSALTGLPEERIDGLLATLVAKQVLAVRADPLSPDRGQYAFAQTLLRTVAYEMLSRHERKPRHVAAAEHLRATFAGDSEEMAEAIAAHLLDAYRAAQGDADEDGLREQALAALRRAAQRATKVGAPESAERAYRTALELATSDPERVELMEAAGAMAAQAGRYEEAIELFEAAAAALAAAGRGREAVRLHADIGHALRRLGRIEDAIAHMGAAAEDLDLDELAPDVAAVNMQLGTVLFFGGHHAEARASLDRAITAAEALELPGVLCEALVSLGISCHHTGRFELGRMHYEGAIALGERHGLSAEVQRARTNLANLLLNRDLPGAREALEESIAAARRLGIRVQERVAGGNLMQLHLLEGRWGEMDRVLAEDARGAPDSGDLGFSLTLLAVHRGDLGAARAALASLDPWAASEDVEEQAMLGVASAAVALLEGRAHDALEAATGAVELAFGASHDGMRHGWPIAFEAALALGRPDEATALVERLAAQPPGWIPPYVRAHVHRAQGLLAAARGEDAGVETHLRDAVDGFAALGYPYWRAVAETDLGAWLAEQGRADAAEPLLAEAAATLEQLGAAPALERVRARAPAL